MPPSEDNNNPTHFETAVIGHLTELKEDVSKIGTKMEMIISDDGETGSVPRLQRDVKAIEKKMYLFSGAALGIGGLIHYIIDTVRAVKGH
jgi:hypothetical protein